MMSTAGGERLRMAEVGERGSEGRSVVSSRKRGRFFPRSNSTSFNVIQHHMLMFHTHSFRCCIHTSYGPTCRIRTHSTSFVSHVSYKHHYVSFIRRIIRTSFATCIIQHSYNIIYDIHHILIIRICIICYHYTSYSIIYLTCMRSYIHTASFKSYVCHITSYMNLILWSQR